MGVIANPNVSTARIPHGGAEKAPDRTERWIAAGVLLFILNAAFFPFLWGKKTLFFSSIDAPSVLATGAFGARGKTTVVKSLDPGSAAWQFEPSLALTHKEYFIEKNAPLWDPYRAFGTPLAASMQAQPFYPLTFLLSIHPSPRLHAIFLIARLFLAGWFGYLFFRLFLTFFPSLAGAITLMLSGYYILYLPIAHLSVDVLVGAAFYGVERLLRHPSYKTIAFVAGVFFLTLVGGMPETAFLIWCYATAYSFFRITTEPEFRSNWGSRTKALTTAAAWGLGSAMFLLLPFVEFMRVSFDVHQFVNTGAFVGLGYDSTHRSGYLLLQNLSTYLAPLLFGPPFHNILNHFSGSTGLRGYFGVIGFTLALVGAIATIREIIQRRFSPVVSLGVFFLVSVLLFWMKRFGAGAVNWIGHLPLFSLIIFPKYLEVLQAMAVASLAAIGCSYFLNRRFPLKWIFAALAIVSLGFAVLLRHLYPVLHQRPVVHVNFFYDALWGASVLLLCMAVYASFLRQYRWCIVVLIAGELCWNYLVPAYYIFNKPPDAQHTAYKGAPYISLLQSEAGMQWRIFGRDYLMFPNWSEAFGLFDVRSLDAMYVNKYFRFIQFFLKNDTNPASRDLIDRFIGSESYRFDTQRQLRFLQLGSVKYLLTSRPFLAPGSLTEQIWIQNSHRLTANPQVAIRDFTIQGQTKATLQEHPPFRRLPVRIVVPESNPVLRFAIGIDSVVYAPPILGGGVTFTIEGRDVDGHIRKLFSKYIDPKHDLRERKWLPQEVSLSAYRGQSIDLLFSTDGGKDTRNDWAGWADLQIAPASQSTLAFQRIYDKEVMIYRFDHVLPRATVFHDLEMASDDAAALSMLGDSKLDIFNKAVVPANTLTPSDKELLQQIRQFPEARGKAEITHYDSQHVTVSASLDQPGLLVLNDTDYPGWTAYVDGQAAHIVSANYLFRGVFLHAGQHVVEFRYQPRSFIVGLLLSCITLLSATAVLMRANRRKLS